MVSKETEWGDVDLIRLAENMDSWRVLVNAVMNFWSHKNMGNVLTS
jgi:hypothetical protein